MVEVRTKFQPRQLLEVPEQEAQVLRDQGLLWEGSDEELAALLASDPIGPLDPRPEVTATAPEKAAAKSSAPAATAAPVDAKPADTAKGA